LGQYADRRTVQLTEEQKEKLNVLHRRGRRYQPTAFWRQKDPRCPVGDEIRYRKPHKLPRRVIDELDDCLAEEPGQHYVAIKIKESSATVNCHVDLPMQLKKE
jgi:hypothetical protein